MISDTAYMVGRADMLMSVLLREIAPIWEKYKDDIEACRGFLKFSVDIGRTDDNIEYHRDNFIKELPK